MDESSELNVAELRVTGPDRVLEELKVQLGLRIDAEWKKGEEKRIGGNHKASGFNANIADEPSIKEMMEAVSNFIGNCEKAAVSFKAEGMSAEVDIGISVSTDEPIGPRVNFDQSTIIALGALGLGLEISTYPASKAGQASAST